MCEQTEINYLEGDVVWVKLGAYWWPGQVTNFDNLSDDIKKEFIKKPIIAAVKFFQEDTYEFVKNYQQIYKYNCTHKDEFIKKGLDKFRSKNKEGSSIMDKFPGDVETAERLTGGDPDILNSEKFNPEEKPDLSGLFGEKKLPKKKRDRDFSFRRSDGTEVTRQITHPRFLNESDHEIRIRPQDSLPSTPTGSSTGGLYPCYMCDFTTTRVNVIICHMKSHFSGGISSTPHSKSKNHIPKSRLSDTSTPKRKITRKPHSNKSKNESITESGKRKQTKQPEPAIKKKKIDPVSCEKLLEDWDDGSDEESLVMDNLSTPMDTSSIIEPTEMSSPNDEVKDTAIISKDETEDDGTKMLEETEKLLKETDSLTKLQLLEDLTDGATNSNNKLNEIAKVAPSQPKVEEKLSPKKGRSNFHFKKTLEPEKPVIADSDDKKARLSCFDFNEDDMSEPTITPVRKLPRVKNMSLKKELIIEYQMSEARKNEKQKESLNIDLKSIIHDPDAQEKPVESKEKTEPTEEDLIEKHSLPKDEIRSPKEKATSSKVKISEHNIPNPDSPEKMAKSDTKSKGTSKSNSKIDSVEIVEIFEVEREDEVDEPKNFHKSSKKDPGPTVASENFVKSKEITKEKFEVFEKECSESKTADQQSDIRMKTKEASIMKENKDRFSEKMVLDTEDETVSESADTILGHSENSDTDCTLPDVISEIIGVKIPMRTIKHSSIETVETGSSANSTPRKRRGRPRKNLAVEMPSSDSEQLSKIKKTPTKLGSPDRFESEGKTSESDTDRSSSGRRRKPNRKYQSNLYMQCLDQKAAKTDESQSESDDRPVEYYKTKSRKGRKSQSLRKKSIDSIAKDEELEFSDQADQQPKKSKMSIVFDQNKSDDEQPLLELHTTVPLNNEVVEFKKDESINVPIAAPETEVIVEPVIGLDHKEIGEEVSLKKDNISNKTNNLESLIIDSNEIKPTSQEESNGPRQSINMLPPKKSQIKKFELSQIDFLESTVHCEKNRVVESEIKTDKIEDMEIEPPKIDSGIVISQISEKTVEDSVAAVHGESLEVSTMETTLQNSSEFAPNEEKKDKFLQPHEDYSISSLKTQLESQLEDKSDTVEENLMTGSNKEPSDTSDSRSIQETSLSSVSIQESSTHPEPMQELVLPSVPTQDTSIPSVPVQDTSVPSVPVQDISMPSVPVQDASMPSVPVRDTSMPSISKQDILMPSVSKQDIAMSSAAVQDTSMTCVSVQETKMTSVPVQETSMPSIVQYTSMSSEPEQDASMSSAVVHDTSMISVQVQDTSIISEPVENPSMTSVLVQDTLMSTTAQDTLMSPTPAQDTVMSSMSIKEPLKTSEVTSPKKTSIETRFKGKFTPETGFKYKKDRDAFLEDKRYESFQDAFVKTLQIDKHEKKLVKAVEEPSERIKKYKKPVKKRSMELSDTNTPKVINTSILERASEALIENTEIPANEIQQAITNPSIYNVEKYEIVGADNDQCKDKSKVITSHSEDKSELLVQLTQDSKPEIKTDNLSTSIVNISNVVSGGFKKLNEAAVSSPSSVSDISVPVKKREKPRIIENVTLKEPMILKSKLLEKIPYSRIGKHKLETDSLKKTEQKSSPKAKVMKIDSTPTNSKSRSPNKGSHMSLTKKLQALKAEEIIASRDKQKVTSQLTQTITALPITEKYIQQSSESLVDMDLDINSMPFVMSEDLLTPENIDQIPVVISGIIPSSSIQPSTISLASPTQVVTTNQTFQTLKESVGEVGSSKKKSGTPTILKSKGKAKPTITSIKTIVPPLTGGVKGLKFQNTQGTRTSPLISQKGPPGKYVIVQTTGNPPMRFSVQGKAGTPQKIAIPANSKSSPSAQLVQQGSKVVILTSPQSGTPKVVPLNISKALSGKAVHRIMTSKGQVFTPVSQGVITSKTLISPKSMDSNSPTTSKMTSGQKIINAQGIITSKGVLTPLPGTISKSSLLGLPQGILTKSGIYTPISAAALGGKTILGSKTLVTSKGTTILSPQNISTSKLIGSMTQSGKILSAQGIVTSKGTVLTPITGQQVKAIAAKSPAKGKIQYQQIQRKMPLPTIPKTQKSSSTSPQIRNTSKTASNIVVQNALPEFKTSTPTRKGTKQLINQQVAISTVLASPNSTQVSVSSPIQQKKVILSSPAQKIITPRGSNRPTKAQQKYVVQKMHDPVSPVQSVQLKGGVTLGSSPGSTKVMQQKNLLSNTSSSKSTSRSQKAPQQKNILNAAINSITASTSSQSTCLSIPATMPSLEPINQDRKMKVEDSPQPTIIKVDSNVISSGIEKVDEAKAPSMPQIMALPTESSDGTQTYVLVTIDEQGQIQPLDNNTLMSLDGTTQNPDGSRTLYIDPSSLGESGGLDNIVLQFDNGSMSNLSATVATSSQTVVSDHYSTPEIVHAPNQDILAAALANTDFQQEIGLPEHTTANLVTAGLTQTSLINQTILQSTIIPPTEPISSPAVLETSLTLNQPIMTPLEVPSSLPIQSEATPVTAISTVPTSLNLPITITNPNISYITTDGSQIQIPGNSMPDIGEIMETQTVEIAQTHVVSTAAQYLVIPNLEEGITVQASEGQKGGGISYSVSIPDNMIIEANPIQTTPSMPIIDDNYTEDSQFNKIVKTSSTDDSFNDISVTEMLVPKVPGVSSKTEVLEEEVVTSDVTQTPERSSVSSQEILCDPVSSQDIPDAIDAVCVSTRDGSPVTTNKTISEIPEESTLKVEESTIDISGVQEEVMSSQEITATSKEQESNNELDSVVETVTSQNVEVGELPTEGLRSTLTLSEGTSAVSSESYVEAPSSASITCGTLDTTEDQSHTSHEAEVLDKHDAMSEELPPTTRDSPIREQVETSDREEIIKVDSEVLSSNMASVDPVVDSMEIDESIEDSNVFEEKRNTSDIYEKAEPSSQAESKEVTRDSGITFDEAMTETSQEVPSQSYEQFDTARTSDAAEVTSQSTKSENSREPSQSVIYESMEVDDSVITGEPPTQSFEDSKRSEASQSYDALVENNTNAPTQSFNEIMQCQDDRPTTDEMADDPSFPTQSYEVEKMESLTENLEIDPELSQEGNIPSQSNDIGNDGIGTSSIFTNNSGLNEDETASSSYVPETPETQERDQDQESAISTSSYEIPPCDELNIASSSEIPDTSVRSEHSSIHNNGVPEIPTSSYNLNPDSSSTHVDAEPTSSYEDQVIVEQNVSTSYNVPISMTGLEETSSQNFVTESTDHQNEPTSYYPHHPEVTASYYESMRQESNSRLEVDPQEEVTPSYYEANPCDISSEASQSYFAEEATPSYSSHSVGYYEPRPEGEASQSFYSSQDLRRPVRSSLQNVEATQSFYQDNRDGQRMRQRGEATPTYTERYPVDYVSANSPLDRHDLVESSVPATKPTER